MYIPYALRAFAVKLPGFARYSNLDFPNQAA